MLTLDRVSKVFSARGGLVERLTRSVPPLNRAVDDVSLQLRRGETFGLVGESGCGKSTLARIVAGLIRPTSGTIRFDVAAGVAHPRVQMIFQDPFSSLNPRWPIGRIIAEPIQVHRLRPRESVEARVDDLLTQVGLAPSDARKFPQEFSGGQCQRVSIARALAGEPDFLILDEPTSALDVSVQAQILMLLRDLQQRLGLTCLFITHNLAVVRAVAQRVGVMYLGQIVETGETEALFSAPRHPYTRLLIEAAPDVDVTDRALKPIPGEIHSRSARVDACRFHARCPWVQDICRTAAPPLQDDGTRAVRCHFPLLPDASTPPPVRGYR